MSKVYGALVGYDEFYEVQPPVVSGMDKLDDRSGELGEAIRRQGGFQCIRFCGYTDEGKYGYIARNALGEWQVIADYDLEYDCAGVECVLLMPGRSVVQALDVFL